MCVFFLVSFSLFFFIYLCVYLLIEAIPRESMIMVDDKPNESIGNIEHCSLNVIPFQMDKVLTLFVLWRGEQSARKRERETCKRQRATFGLFLLD